MAMSATYPVQLDLTSDTRIARWRPLVQWFLANSVQLKYTLESFHDYQPAPSGPDPACLTISAAKGVTAADVNKRFTFTS